MSDRIEIVDELPRGALPRGLEKAWRAIWQNFRLLLAAQAVGFEEVTITPSAGSNTVPHKLGAIPRRWTIVRAYQVTGAVYETARSSTELTLSVVSVGTDPELVVRLW